MAGLSKSRIVKNFFKNRFHGPRLDVSKKQPETNDMPGNLSMQWRSIHASRLMLAWLITGILTVVVPLIIMGAARGSLRRQQQNNGDGNDDGNNNNNNNNNQDGDGYNRCRWWQWGCSNYYNEDGEQQQQDDGEERSTPWWWFFGSEEERREREEEGRAGPALVFTYVWSLIVFCCILAFGCREIASARHGGSGGDVSRVVVALVVYANFAFVTMLLIGGLEGGVQTEGRELEEQGFYAQFAVMMFLSNLFCLIFSVVFAIILTVRARRASSSTAEKIDVDESDYQLHYPEIKVVSNNNNNNSSGVGTDNAMA